jgi:hypothetical protein
MGAKINVYNIFIGKPEGKRPFGSPNSGMKITLK